MQWTRLCHVKKAFVEVNYHSSSSEIGWHCTVLREVLGRRAGVVGWATLPQQGRKALSSFCATDTLALAHADSFPPNFPPLLSFCPNSPNPARLDSGPHSRYLPLTLVTSLMSACLFVHLHSLIASVNVSLQPPNYLRLFHNLAYKCNSATYRPGPHVLLGIQRDPTQIGGCFGFMIRAVTLWCLGCHRISYEQLISRGS